jgi:Ca2+-binding EF-hand superfamily protein
LLENIENALFNGHRRLFEIYRSLDKDGDGYISYIDFETALRNDYKLVASS